MFPGSIDKQHRDGLQDEQKHYPQFSTTICKNAQIFVTCLLLVDVLNEWPQFNCLCKK